MRNRLPLPPGAIPITPLQLAVLLAAGDGEAHTLDEIGARVDRTKGSLFYQVHALREKGLLVDAPPSTRRAVATDLAPVVVQLRGRE